MNRMEICAAARKFVEELNRLGAGGDVNLLLTPDNLLIGGDNIALKQAAPQGPAVGYYPGFSAPEAAAGQAGPASAVYFMGAVMYMLLTGAPPPDARQRAPGTPPLPAADALSALVDRALALDAAQRFANISDLAAALGETENKLRAAAPAPVAFASAPAASPASAPAAPSDAAPAPAPSVTPPAPFAPAPVASAPVSSPAGTPAAPSDAAPAPAPFAPAPAASAPVQPGTMPVAFAPAPAAQPPANTPVKPADAAPAPLYTAPPPAAFASAAPPPASVSAAPSYAAPASAPSYAAPAPAPSVTPSAPFAPTPAAPSAAYAPAGGASAAYGQGPAQTPGMPGASAPPRPYGAAPSSAYPPAGGASAAYGQGSAQTPGIPGASAPPPRTGAAPSSAYPPAGGASAAYGQGPAQTPGMAGASMPPAAPPPPPKKKKKGLVIGIVAAVVLVLGVGGFFGWTAVQKSNAEKAFDGGDYTELIRIVDGTSWIKEDFTRQYDYSQAQLLLESDDRDGALALLDDLGNYLDSAELANATRYDMAMDLLDEGDYAGSLELFEGLAEDEYEDSADYAENLTLYLEAADIEDAMDRYNAYLELGDFLDSDALAQEAIDEVYGERYEEAIQLYTDGDFVEAGEIFAELPSDYENSGLYAEACELYGLGAISYLIADKDTIRECLTSLGELADTIDVEGIVMSNIFFQGFLEGEWISSDGGGIFGFDWDQGYFFEDFPEVSGTYLIRDKKFTPQGSGAPTVNVTYVGFNEIKMEIEGQGTFTYTR